MKPVTSEELILKLARQVDRARKLREASSAARAPVVNAATLAAIEARLDVQGSAIVRLGRFEVRSILGRGSMGTVFKAWDTKLERWVAIKTVRAGKGMAEFWDGDVVRGLVSEAAMVARFNHPHVVSVYDVQDATDAAVHRDGVRGRRQPRGPRPPRPLCRPHWPCPCCAPWPARWPPRTPSTYCTATSSPGTCCSAGTAPSG